MEKVKNLWHEMTQEEKDYAAWKKIEDAVFADLADMTQKNAALAYEQQKKQLAENAAAHDKAVKAAEDAAKKAAEILKKQQEAVDKLAASFMSEAEKEQIYYDAQVKLLEGYNQKAFDYANQRHELLQNLEEQHQKKILEIRRIATETEYEGALIQVQFDTQQQDEQDKFSSMVDQMLVDMDAAKVIDESQFFDLIDSELVAMDAANTYKLNAQNDFVAAFIQGDLDRVNAVVTNGDAELEAKKKQMSQTVSFFGQGLAQMAQGQGKAAKAAQAIQKAQALYEIGVNTYRAAVGAYAALSPIPFVGPALGVAAAAAAIAFGGAMAQGVLSGGSGGAAAVGGAPAGLPTSSFPTSQAEQRQTEQQNQQITYLRIGENDVLLGRTLLDLVGGALADNGGKIKNLRIIPA